MGGKTALHLNRSEMSATLVLQIEMLQNMHKILIAFGKSLICSQVC